MRGYFLFPQIFAAYAIMLCVTVAVTIVFCSVTVSVGECGFVFLQKNQNLMEIMPF